MERIQIKRLAAFLFFTIAPLAAYAADKEPVFVKATCEGTISSNILSSLKDAIRASDKYRLIASLDDNGRMDTVLAIQMSCNERENLTAVATVYGQAKCFGPAKCHAAFDVPSLRVEFCDSLQCGRALFKAFEDYLNNPGKTHLILE
jgi:hypothetical protein